MTLGEFIKNYRMEHKMSQRAFAEMCDLSNAYVSMLEKNENTKNGQPITPSLVTFQKVAHVVGLSLNDFLEILGDAPVSLAEYDETDVYCKLMEHDADTMEFVKLFNRLNKDQKAFILGEIKALLQGI